MYYPDKEKVLKRLIKKRNELQMEMNDILWLIDKLTNKKSFDA